tara:strand:+ start:1258 stop:1713 length:456 start_codon:yes stop_codon:yes gene_type:complete
MEVKMSTTTKKAKPSKATLDQIVWQYVTYHTQTSDLSEKYTEARINDLCFVANNSLVYKKKIMSDLKAELKTLDEQYSGSEVQDVQIYKKTILLKRMIPELQSLKDYVAVTERVYKEHTGSEYKHNGAKATMKPNAQAVMSELKELINMDI